jgi:predicted transposase YbfD/YdcC
MLGQVKVESKSNEIKAIPALLNLLELTGCIITLDAMGSQTASAQQIIDREADYILCLKANHPTLYNQVKTWFDKAIAQGFQGITAFLIKMKYPEIWHHLWTTSYCSPFPVP